jgi:hypothetical protein
MDPVAADREETQTHRELADDSGLAQKMTRKSIEESDVRLSMTCYCHVRTGM